ncbi:hypothetical protein ACILDT_10845 [Capnocytophaga canis]|uniref:Uncharacterized protein n=1 Tax=Capnocytophaga canis TaxID=1848903 RepID=A0A0B7IQ10_9FLAO|nr:hypothetical protein [Capnocytophaga canis]CEN52674.1 hypothetical protein CCAND93_280006 [Capnocytophaga canis]
MNDKQIILMIISSITVIILLYILYVSNKKKNTSLSIKEKEKLQEDLKLIEQAKSMAKSIPVASIESLEIKIQKFEKAYEKYNGIYLNNKIRKENQADKADKKDEVWESKYKSIKEEIAGRMREIAEKRKAYLLNQ